MALSTSLQLKTTQSLALTPQLLQAIRLLQMSSVEVFRYVDREQASNPLLQHADEVSGALQPESDSPTGDTDGGPHTTPDPVSDDGRDNAGEYRPGHSNGAGPGNGPGDTSATTMQIGEMAPAPESLHDRLAAQIELEFPDHQDRFVAWYLVSQLDECGYLEEPGSKIATDLGIAPDRITGVLEQCRTFEPAGMFSRTLAECLGQQLARLDRLDPAMRTLLDNLDLLATGRPDDRKDLRRRCGVDGEDLAQMIAEIRALDPKPGLAGETEPVSVRIPDILVHMGPSGEWMLELNPQALPNILVDRDYHAQVMPQVRDVAGRRFMSECLQQATWLEKSLDQRARTILSVATEIVRRQDDFLRDGVAGLRPMNLKMISEKISMHESTVSRAVANKTMATPRGLIDLKMFFSGGLASTCGGADHAAAAVKHRIRKLIDAERPDAILSDDALVTLLHGDEIGIARRTVAKYRESLGLGSSVARRRQKRTAVAL